MKRPPRSLRSLPLKGAQSVAWDGPGATDETTPTLAPLAAPKGAQSVAWDGPAPLT